MALELRSLNALVVGQGSIGRRHSEILRNAGAQVSVVSAHDAGAFPVLAAVPRLDRLDYTVIASSTSRHDADLAELNSRGFRGRVLVEKPLAAASNVTADISGFRKFRVGYNLRLHPVVEALRAALAGEEIVAVRMHAGQYLPDWRPGADFRRQSSARRDMAGGVLRDLSHEIDLVLHLFGSWRRLVSAPAPMPVLDIETDQAWAILFELEAGSVVTLTLSYHDQPLERRYVVTTRTGTFEADLTRGFVRTPLGRKDLPAERNFTYERQHALMQSDDETVLCDYAAGMAVLKTLEAIERSAMERAWQAK